jgi:hypothetical protein
MSQDELYLYAVTARVVDEFTSAALLFTALDISNAVKQSLPEARHREISPIVRDIFERRGMGAYMQTQIDVMAQGQKPVKALLYHLPEQTPAMYDDSMRSQLAIPPQRLVPPAAPEVASTSTDAHVRIGKDGRGRVPRALIENAGIKGDRVLVKPYPAVPSLQILAADATTPTQASATSPVNTLDVFFAATAQGQPLNYEHPTLLHIPRSLLDMFGADPQLVARIDGSSVVIVRR